MNQYQHADMYDYPADRSPNSIRGYSGVQRQTSRHFENTNYGGTQQGLYTADDHVRYDTGPQDYRTSASTIHVSQYIPPYENQTWGGYGGGINTMGGTGRMKQSQRRNPLPSAWSDNQMTMTQQLPPYGGPQLNEQPYGGHQMSNNPHLRHSPPPDHEELIPTAIVIKNIPFAVKKENLQEIMQNMNLPLPYAFNYHFDNGVFRGLAFANFTSPEETQRVISTMNQMELQGRKLRVEYKKMLPVAERDRIERDKRERRGQLQEQHQPINNNQLHNQGSMNSISSNIPATSPSPISQRTGGKLEFDLNDPQTLDFYTQLTLFKNDATREALVFPHDTTPTERRVIHTLAHHMGLEHRSEGQGDHRQVTIFRHRPTVPVVPHIAPHGTGGGYYNESRRGLNRAATVDFTENRLLQSDSSELFLRRQGSTLLDVPASPSNLHHQIRGAKSFADLRSFSPSPAPSTSSFPTNLAQNASRYHNEYHNPNPSGTPNLTPTSATGMNARDDLVSGMNSLGLRESSSRTNFSAAGPIGSQRPINGQFDETSRNGATGVPQRQPKGPSATEWSQGGFSGRNRQNGHINRGSGELDLNTINMTWDDNMN